MAEEQQPQQKEAGRDDQVDEDYAVWRKNTPFLYDLAISHALEWPSLTVHWVPLPAPLPHASDPSLAVHRLVLGTHTAEGSPNFLMVADALLPREASETSLQGNAENPIVPKVEITQKIRVDGEVNRARCMPQNPVIVGAKTSGPEVYVFDCTKQSGKQQGGDCDPDLRLRGHDMEGYGLSWSPFKEGYLLSGSHDNRICLWDVSAMAQDKVLDALHAYEAHESVVEDVSWHSKNENLFGSVGDDCRLIIWDLRTNQPQHSVKAHEKEVNYLSFNPYNEWILATASSDTTIGLFDTRKLSVPLHVLSSHTEEVFQVEWDPNHETVLASSADDRRLMVWDLNRIGDEIMRKQEDELQGLRKAFQEKEEKLVVSMTLRKLEEEKLNVAEANLEKRTMEWLLSQEELKKLAEEATQHARETNETLEDFRRVKKLLDDVRSELVSSQKSLASSRQKMEEQEVQLEKQLSELEEQKKSVMSYMVSLKDAQIEVETERVKLRVAEARNKELELDLSIEKELTEELQEKLKKEKSSLQEAIQEMSFLQKELEQKNKEFEEMHNILQVKESESVDAKLEIQHLKSEQAALQLILEEKDLELLNARTKLEELNEEIGELKMLMNSREDQLIQATTMLKEKDEHVQMMQDELNDAKLKFSEAETVAERIVELTNKLVTSIKDENSNAMGAFDDMGHTSLKQLLEKPKDVFSMQKRQLETELKLTIESLRMKEMELLAVERALTIKDEELRTVRGRLDGKEKELKKMKEEMKEDANDLRKLYTLAQERIGDTSIGDLAIEKLQLEAAQLEVEAATCALHKLADMSRELLNKASLSLDADSDVSVFPQNGSDTSIGVADRSECLAAVKSEVVRLSALTEQLVRGAGIVGAD